MSLCGTDVAGEIPAPSREARRVFPATRDRHVPTGSRQPFSRKAFSRKAFSRNKVLVPAGQKAREIPGMATGY